MNVEREYVHNVYRKLASFAKNKNKKRKWQFVQNFLNSLPYGSIVLDIGK